MTDSTVGMLTADQSAPAPAPASDEESLTQDNASQEEAASEQEQPDTEEEIEYSGNKYRIPKELKSAFMFQADYTRKTQEVAEQRKAYEARQQELAKEAEAHATYRKELGEIYALDQALAHFAKVDWQQRFAEDPINAGGEHARFQQLKDYRTTLAQNLLAKDAEASEKAKRDYANRVQEGLAVVQREIKGWTPELGQKLLQYARDNALEEADITAFQTNPRMVKLLHKAWLGEEIARKTAAANAQQKQQEQPPPVARIARGKSAPATSGLSDDLPIDEWMKRRSAQIHKRGGA